MKNVIKISEEDLAKKLVDFLKENDYNNLYFEVYGTDRKRPIDVVVKLDDMNWGIEVKTCLNLNVILQAIDCLNYCQLVSIFVPYVYLSKLKNYEYKSLHKILYDNGIGLIEYHYNDFINERIKPNAKKNKCKALTLFENSKNSIPGCKHGKRETAFSTTKDNILEYVKNNPGKKLSEIICNVKHHYTSNSNGVNSIRQYIKNGIIKELDNDNGKIYLR